jgi:hypothetical protein
MMPGVPKDSESPFLRKVCARSRAGERHESTKDENASGPLRLD